MLDMIPAGTGDSRYLKSVADFLSRYPTYEDMAAALVAGTLPIDLNGINPDGVTQMGTALSKANLLTDDTAAMFGMSSTAVPNDILSLLSNGAIPIVEAEGGDPEAFENNAYVGTSARVTQLSVGTKIVVVPKTESENFARSSSPYSAPTFNLNGFGDYPVMPFAPGANGKITDFYGRGYFYTNVPMLLFFDGSAWRTNVGATRIAVGSYTGTGIYGAHSNNISVALPFNPQIFSLYGEETTMFSPADCYNQILQCKKMGTNFTQGEQPSVPRTNWSTGYCAFFARRDSALISWYNTASAEAQRNEKGKTYNWLAIG